MGNLRLASLFAVFTLVGCGGPCPELDRLDATAQAPGLVQMVFSIECRGEPVTDLTASDLTLFEGGEEVARSESDWKLDRFSAVLQTYTLLMIDVSDSIVDEGAIEDARLAAATFARTVIEQGQLVGVSIFDGAIEVREAIDFTDDVDAVVAAIDAIDAEDQLDGSTNLNGAIEQGLDRLDEVVEPDVEGELHSVGSMVVFTDGLDQAQRVSDSRARSLVGGTDHHVFVVGLVDEAVGEELQELAPDGFYRASDVASLQSTFEDLTDSLVAEVNKYYRLSYCSPLRSPRTTLKVEVQWEDRKDTLKFSYPTREFGQGCTLPAG